MDPIIVMIWDMDKTLVDSRLVWDNDQLQNNNDNCRTAKFAEALFAAKPFPWVSENEWLFQSTAPTPYPYIDTPEWIPRFNIIVTGRLPEHERLTGDWFQLHTKAGYHGYVSVPWDDTCATREESHKRYIAAKVDKITSIVEQFLRVTWATNAILYVNIYEDDERVLAGLSHVFSTFRDGHRVLGWVVRDGAAPVSWYPDEVHGE